MNSIQASTINPYNCIQKHQGSSASGSRSRPCRVAIKTRRSFGSSSLQLTAKEVMCYQASKLPLLPVHKYRRLVPFGSFGGQGKSDSDGEGSGQKSVETAFGSIPKKLSVEEILRNQMEKQDFFDTDDGGNVGGKPPRGGGGGGGSGGGGGGNLPEGEGLGEYFDEILQVILATSALLMLYIYIINGEELGKLAQDYMKYVRTGKESMRLAIARHKWGMYFKSGRDKKKDDPPDWLEKEILGTPTWYDSPDKYRRILDPEALEKKASKKKNKKKKKDSPYKEEDEYGEKEDDYEEKEVAYGEEEEEDYGEEEDNEDQEEEEEEEAASPYGDEEDDKDD